MSLTCDTCQWWDDEPCCVSLGSHGNRDGAVTRLCNNPKINPPREIRGHTVIDGLDQCGMDAGYPSNVTGPKFGCIHHESK